MKLVDTHAHFQFEAYKEDRDQVIKENLKELSAIMTVGASLESSKNGVSLVQNYDGLFAAVGVHPHHVDQFSPETMKELEQLIIQPKVVAVGEIGLDKHLYQGYPEPNIKDQIKILEPQINLALKSKRPILFHCRDAYDELFDLLKTLPQPLLGLMHCFMGDVSFAKKFLDLGLFISFSGNLTYKGNDYIRQAAKFVPLDRLLLETDSPYLTPHPFRGQRNEPKYVKIIAETVSLLKSLSLETVAQATTTNAKKLLSI
ncbi:MAG: TatD family hydrolase [bacterium]|nr:TatD family hydrolase [bacterium]